MTMIERTVTRQGLVNISRQIRGADLDGPVSLSVQGKGIKISPIRPGTECPPGGTITKFDQYNRICLPERFLEATGIKRAVQVVRIKKDGALLLLAPPDTCVLCGARCHLYEVRPGKFLCSNCKGTLSTTVQGGNVNEV